MASKEEPHLITLKEFLARRRSQKFLVMEFGIFGSEPCGDFFGVENYPVNFPRKIGLKFVTKTSPYSSHWGSQWAKEICHLLLTQGAISRNNSPFPPPQRFICLTSTSENHPPNKRMICNHFVPNGTVPKPNLQGGFQAVVRVLSGDDIPLLPFNLNSTECDLNFTWVSSLFFWCVQLLPRPFCRNVSEDFCCTNFGGFSRGFSWFWALFPTKMRRTNPARKSAKKSGGPKIKIREKSVLPQPDPNNWQVFW